MTDQNQLKRELIIKFLETFTKVKGKPFKLYDYQKRFIEDESTFRIVNKARQLGFTLIMGGEGLVESLMDKNAVILFLSTSENAARRVLDYCKQLFYSIPAGIRPKTSKNSSTEMQFLDEKRRPAGQLVSLPNNPNTCRGFNATRIYIDEAAHFKEEDKIFRAIQPSISRGGKMTVSSSPCGRSNNFYNIWANEKEYSKHLIPYTACPDPVYIKRIEDMRLTMDELSFAQEYCCEFREDAYAYFPEKIIAPCIDNELGQYFNIKQRQGSVHMGIDWAKKEDSTAVVVGEHISKDKLFVVRRIELYKKIPYEKQLNQIYEICRELEVEKIFCDQTGVGEKLYEDLVNNSGVLVEGINFTLPTKELLITNLRIMFEGESIRIPRHKQLIKQLRSLERTYTEQGHVRFRHVSNEHDDAIWGLAMAASEFKRKDRDFIYKLGAKRESQQLYDKDENENMAKIRKLF
uniref:Putative terminase n=1 Tax=viral metagenome TaxID=1070528 RepID=A0A6M3KBV8_9ZZZZ